MVKLDLNGQWKMSELHKNEWINANVPGSVMQDLLENNLIDDPFYRDNEDYGKVIASKDYIYKRSFTVDEEIFENDHIALVAEGIDTISEIKINGKYFASTKNMHHHNEWNVRPFLKAGTNEIEITLFSPMKYIEEKQAEQPLWGVGDAVEGYPHIRKAHYMFGWDWGPQLPDLGIWKSIYIQAWKTARVEDVYIRQTHQEGSVTVDVDVQINKFVSKNVSLKVSMTGPDGFSATEVVENVSNKKTVTFSVENPHIWWPNGYGDQPLYKVEVSVEDEDNKVTDQKDYTIGLRTITVRNEKDEWGKSFEFVINGISIFAKGANYIPEDNLIGRVNRQTTERLIQDSVEANFNMIRVWGGGYYPSNEFYELCDQYGLIVWQDFMFACSVYDLTDELKASVRKEVEDNVKRLRHHASLGLWCGNNEVEAAWVHWNLPKNPKLKGDYIKLFEVLIQDAVKELDPQTFYWPSSPSSGGSFDEPSDPNSGDVHYWDVWHGQKPFTEYRKFNFRFCSEFGFQSFPSDKTVETFTLPEDRNIFTYVMEKHQKNGSANGKILYYLSENFLYPKDFSSLIYASQLLQAEAIKYGVEHWRRHLGRSMGALYWQLNDCWPVASWSSIDSLGRWKALHYFAKKFYAPVLLSICEEGTDAEIHVTNESLEAINAVVEWKLRKNSSEVVKEGVVKGQVNKLSTLKLESLSFADELEGTNIRDTYLECKLILDGKEVSTATVLFTKTKHFNFVNPGLKTTVVEEENRFVIKVSAESGFAKYVELDFATADGKFSDNYFDLSAGDVREIEVLKSSLSSELTVEDIENELTIRSIFDIA